MTLCSWPRGCTQDAIEGELCTYHRKIETGLIDTTRAPTWASSIAIAPVVLTPEQRVVARAERSSYYERLDGSGARRDEEQEAG